MAVAAMLTLHAASRTDAQTPASTAPVLKAELEPLAFFSGRWDCSGEFVASKKPIFARISVTADLDGSWIAFRWDDQAPNPFHALELWGYDKTARRFTNFIHDNFGGVRMFDSPGWDGNALVWTGDKLASPPALNQRFLFERKSPSEFVVSWQVLKSAGEWVIGDRLTCSR